MIGHVNLRVANLAEAEAFYVGVLGFDMMARYGSQALFVSAGGYHGHVGLNTWEGVDVPPPPPGSIGLRHFDVCLPNTAELDRVTKRVRDAGVTMEETPAGVLVLDPSANAILLTVSTREKARTRPVELKRRSKEHLMNAVDILKYGHLTVLQTLDGFPESAWDTPGMNLVIGFSPNPSICCGARMWCSNAVILHRLKMVQ